MNYPGLASRIFGVPLLIERHKLETIVAVLSPRLGIETDPIQASGPGDDGRKRKDYYVTEDKLAVIDVMGPLVKRASGDFMSGGPTTYSQIETEFIDAVTDPSIRGILLQVDSPGGESVGAFELSDLIFSQRGQKPIYAVADGDAFSAAYALASAADRLYVTKSGGVGSVGVWMLHVDQSGWNEQRGIKPTFIFAGARKVDGNPHEPLSDEARESFQAEVDRVYSMFVDTVARNRSVSADRVRRTEAGLYFGENALEVGFADAVGGVNDALDALRSAVNAPLRSGFNAAVSAAMQANTQEVQQMPPNEEHSITVTFDAEALEAATAASRSLAAEIVEMCVLAGMPALAAGFIREGRDIESVRGHLLLARAQQDQEMPINSHVLPETAAQAETQVDVNESPVVKAAERLAQAGKKGR